MINYAYAQSKKGGTGIEIIVLASLAVIIVLLLGIFFKLGKTPNTPPDTVFFEEDEKDLSPCPLCRTMLKRGEKVHSVVYPGKDDRLVEIYGCPYCYPQNHDYKRVCPVCGVILSPQDLVYGRMFVSAGKKPHIHVNGCTSCMKRR